MIFPYQHCSLTAEDPRESRDTTMQGVPGRTALVRDEVTPSGRPVARALRASRATGTARAAEAATSHVAAPLPLPSLLAFSAGPR